MANSSAHYEDLREELTDLKETLKNQVKQGICSEATLASRLSEGDRIIRNMRTEVDLAPSSGGVRGQMLASWSALQTEWTQFKNNCTTPVAAGGFAPIPGYMTGVSGVPQPHAIQLSRGLDVLERTSNSLARAEQVARESEQIGTECITELGVQREGLERTRDRLTGTNEELKRSHRIILAINRRVITNKFLLIFIILMEIAILLLIIYMKWLRHK